MAAISLSARDIEERLQAIVIRLQMRVRLHALGYALGTTLAGFGAAVWYFDHSAFAHHWVWFAVLFCALTILLAAIISALGERELDPKAIAAWVDRQAQLDLRLATFVAMAELSQRSPLFSVLLLQLLRLAPRYEPTKLVPWRPKKPLLVLAGGLLLFTWAWTHSNPIHAEREKLASAPAPAIRAQADSNHAAEAAGSQPVAPSEFDTGVGSADSGEQSSQASSDTTTVNHAAESSTARSASNARRAPGIAKAHRSRGHGQDQSESHERLFESNPRQGQSPQQKLAGAREPGAGREPVRDQAAGEQEQRQSPSALASAGRERAREQGERESQPNPLEPRQRPESPAPRSGAQGSAGSGTDGASLYAASADPAASFSGRRGEPLVVQLPVANSLSLGSQKQGQRNPAGAAGFSDTAAEGDARSAAAFVQKPLLPPEYEALAKQLFSRSQRP